MSMEPETRGGGGDTDETAGMTTKTIRQRREGSTHCVYTHRETRKWQLRLIRRDNREAKLKALTLLLLHVHSGS